MSWKKKLTSCVLLSGTTIGIMHVVNRLVHHISTIDNLLFHKDEQYYDWRFGRIFYTKQGVGSPILLVHDLDVASSAYEWNKIVDTLSQTNTVYTIDLLGCGRSAKPNLTYTNFLYVQLITDFIKHVICKKTDIICTGESGSFVLMACANDNTVINKVMMVNPQSLITLAKIPTKRTKMVRYIINTPIIGTFIYNMLVNKRSIDENFRFGYYYDQNKIDERSILTYFEASHKYNTRSKYLYSSIKSRYTNANIIHCLKEINNSIFIIVGNSNPENILVASQYQNQLPSIEIIEVNKTKHLPQMEMPDKFVDQIKILFEIDE
ncbi:alpha/beta fold hydrolase [Clostridium sp. C105KSO13]|uniref:alpha/beta fold hydrolase n=1 Tax=Clostridium sp. C105KSO13 TaxID=1776045 RepID=UPI0007407873|nr:alpha/beta fold hydrolase [Clostridium sp. C105KSO13]CUX26529.1 2-hydroxy-6-oxo-6-(2'-aminophenyl)hexa-2, 4-dienoic acid hydrolase [Clostridium sp. C105KSO13]